MAISGGPISSRPISATGRSAAPGGGHFALAVASLVLVGSEADAAVRIDHNQRLLFGKSAVAAPAQPQRLWLWQQSKLPGEAEEERRSDHDDLHRFRTGYQTVAPHRRLMFPAAVADQSVEPDAQRVSHVGLHRYRQAFQTVGQPRLLWPATKIEHAAEPDAQRYDHSDLHLYRQAFQTVGQSYRLWPIPGRRDEAEEHTPRRAHDLTPFRSYVAAAVIARQTLLDWPAARAAIEPEEDARRSNFAALHLYRVGYQTVGQPRFLIGSKASQPGEAEAYDVATARPDLHRYRQAYQTVGQGYRLWPIAASRVEAEDFMPPQQAGLQAFRQYAAAGVLATQPWLMWETTRHDFFTEDQPPRQDHQALHRYRVGYQTVGRLLSLWPAAKADQAIEDDPRRSDHTGLHRYRQNYQTVGQAWQRWIKPQIRVEAEAYDTPRPAGLAPFRQPYTVVQPGQPWWAWPRAIADQTVEPNPHRIEHAAALYPFLPHQAVEPDLCPIFLAEAMARIAELEALLAEALRNQGSGGGGGGDRDYYDEWQSAKSDLKALQTRFDRERIRRNNDVILATATAFMAGRRLKKDPP